MTAPERTDWALADSGDPRQIPATLVAPRMNCRPRDVIRSAGTRLPATHTLDRESTHHVARIP